MSFFPNFFYPRSIIIIFSHSFSLFMFISIVFFLWSLIFFFWVSLCGEQKPLFRNGFVWMFLYKIFLFSTFAFHHSILFPKKWFTVFVLELCFLSISRYGERLLGLMKTKTVRILSLVSNRHFPFTDVVQCNNILMKSLWFSFSHLL